jgi:CRP/FNR family transcriptional regulator, cyclic AMP receptor protein
LDLKRSVLLPYAIEDMFDLIEQAEHYPQFLPWCTGATILERSDEWVAARLEFSYFKVRFGFQTRNPKQRPRWLSVRLVEGPFKHFRGDWSLTQLGDHGCKVEFGLSYEVSRRLVDRVTGAAAEAVARSMLDAFVKRAEKTLTPFAPTQIAAAAAVQTVPRDAVPAPPVRVAREPGQASAPAPAVPVSGNETSMTSYDPAPIEVVRASRLAQDLTPDQASVLASVLRLAAYREGELLVAEGSVDNRLYVVIEGALGVVKHKGMPEETQIATLNPGDFAHELGFIDGTARYASLVAARDSKVLALEREQLESLIDRHPWVVYRVMCAIVRVVHRVQSRLAMQASELTNYIVKQHGRY